MEVRSEPEQCANDASMASSTAMDTSTGTPKINQMPSNKSMSEHAMDCDSGTEESHESAGEEQSTLDTASAQPSRPLSRDERLIADLRTQIPDVDRIFKVHRRIGEGTFSSVFLASMKCQEHKPMKSRRLFAVKHLIPTSHPRRIAQELKCLKEIGGTENVVGVQLCLRNSDAIAFVMPFISHIRFVDYYDKMGARELQDYMRNLLVALRHVHSFNVIHRDVKPSNFLYDRRNQKYLLVDFGLAQPLNKDGDGAKSKAATAPVRVAANVNSTNNANQRADETSAVCDKANEQDKTLDASEATDRGANAGAHNDDGNEVRAKRRASHSNEAENRCAAPNESNPPKRHCGPAGLQTVAKPADERSLQQQQQQQPPAPAPHTPTSNIPSQFKTPLKQINEISTQKGGRRNELTGALMADVKSTVLSYSMHKQIENLRTGGAGARSSTPKAAGNQPTSAASAHKYNLDNRLSGKTAKCQCYARPSVCNMCLVKAEIQATRAGTPGYRPCEVLVKYPLQTTAVDMWAAGVILVSMLSSCYPFFQGTNDFNALSEIIAVFGDEIVSRVAYDLGRQLTSNVSKKALNLRKLCIRLRNRGRFQQQNTLNNDNNSTTSTNLKRTCDNCEQALANCLCQGTPYNMDFSDDTYPESVYDLLGKLMAIHPSERISAAEALQHRFFQENFD